MQNGFADRVGLIWAVADLLRGDYRQADYGKVILPLVVLRRLDCVLETTKQAVLDRAAELEGKITNVTPILLRTSGQSFYNTSKLTFAKLLDDPGHLAANLRTYIAAFSPAAAEVMTHFKFDDQITKLDEADLLYTVVGKFVEVDLHPGAVSNHEMGYIFEELIRRFSEQSNETAGEHFTPREVIRLMVKLLFAEDDPVTWANGTIKTLYDPTCGTGGMLSVAEEFLRDLNTGVRLEVFGQELNDESYAICRSDMMIKGQDPSHIHFGNTLTKDGEKNRKFDYMLSNPPFGVEWKKVEAEIRKEARDDGFSGRFGAGLPRINDGSFLFLQHMIAKMKPVEEGGSRIAIVFNGSPLFTGEAGASESEIRRWIIENDWLEAIVGLPDQLFYNTNLSTYFWIVTNRKRPERQGKVQLIDARSFFQKLRYPLGEKRKEMTPAHIDEVSALVRSFDEGGFSRILPNRAFGYQRVVIERPLRLRYRVPALDVVANVSASLKLSDPEGAMLAAAVARLEALDTKSRQAAALAIGADATLPVRVQKAIWKVVSMKDPEGAPASGSGGRLEADPYLRDTVTVALPDTAITYEPVPTLRLEGSTYREVIDRYFDAEVRPYDPDAWVDHGRTKIGYELGFSRYFLQESSARPITDINDEVAAIQRELALHADPVRDAVVLSGFGPGAAEARRRPVLAMAEVSLGRQRSPDNASGPHMVRYLRAANVKDGVLDLSDVMEMNFTPDEQAVFALRPGDVLVTEGAGSLNAVGANAVWRGELEGVVCFQNTLLRLRPRPGVEPRFVAWWARFAYTSGLLASVAGGANIYHLGAERMRSLPAWLPPLDVQRQIADYLDAEAARIVALTARYRRLVELQLDRHRSLLTLAVTGQSLKDAG